MTGNRNDLAEVPLAGYTDRLSARPGDVIKFCLSTTITKGTHEKVPVRARLTSSISADPNPKGQGIVENDASRYFEEKIIQVRHQPIPRGSFAQTNSNLNISSSMFNGLRKIKIELWLYPTLIGSTQEDQNVWSWGENFRLDLSSKGQLKFLYQNDHYYSKNTSVAVLKQRRWYHITSTLNLSPNRKSYRKTSTKLQELNIKFEKTKSAVCDLSIDVKEKDDRDYGANHSSLSVGSHSSPNNDGIDPMSVSIDAPFTLATGGSLNGRIEDPEIKIETENSEQLLFAAWNTSHYYETTKNCIDPWTIPCSDGHAKSNSDACHHALVLHNHPTRGVKGRRWNGTEFCWTKCPEHYGAIYFHDDDIYDFQWKPSMEWRVPPDIPSGIFIMRFTDEQNHEEALPIFICAPKVPASMPSSETNNVPKRNKLVLLISTFTYVIYGNHARPDFEKDLWLDRTKKSNPGSYPYNPVLFPAYGHSSYDFHSDKTGIHFASHLRPLFNLRPGYISFSRVGGYNDNDQNTQKNSNAAFCSGLRHFPADTHIVSWLHHFGFDFDVITDHELHREGAEALTQYSTLLTCSHPEYHTPQSLDALQKYRDVQGGNLIYLGGNGFYWKIGASREPPSTKSNNGNGDDGDDSDDGDYDDVLSSCKLLEIRRCEGGVRTWAAQPGEYYNLLDGMYGGLWRNSGRPPSKLAGIGFAAQGSFIGKPYHRTCWDRPDITDWVFEGISDQDMAIFGNFGFSGDGAAGYELDRIDPDDELFQDGEIVIVAQADTNADTRYALVPEEVLTPWTNLAGISNEEAKRADMIYFRVPKSGAQVFSVGSITFCGCLPFNKFDNPVSRLIKNVVEHFLEEE